MSVFLMSGLDLIRAAVLCCSKDSVELHFERFLVCLGILVIFIRFHSRLQGLFVCIFNINSCRDVLEFFSLSKEILISSFRHLVPNFLPLLWMQKTFLKLWFVINAWCELGFLILLMHTIIIKHAPCVSEWQMGSDISSNVFSSFHGSRRDCSYCWSLWHSCANQERREFNKYNAFSSFCFVSYCCVCVVSEEIGLYAIFGNFKGGAESSNTFFPSGHNWFLWLLGSLSL